MFMAIMYCNVWGSLVALGLSYPRAGKSCINPQYIANMVHESIFRMGYHFNQQPVDENILRKPWLIRFKHYFLYAL